MDPVQRLNRSSRKKRSTQQGNGNRFANLAVPIKSSNVTVSSGCYAFREFASASHVILPSWFTGTDGTNDGGEDDGEHGSGRLLLKARSVEDVENTFVVVLQWFD